MDTEYLIHRILTDKPFASHFQNDPNHAIQKAGFKIDADSLQALINTLQKSDLVKALLEDSETGPSLPDDWVLPGLAVRPDVCKT
ncbi:MAG: hypothetical protein P8Y14_07910 [Anaerolineales bacterium]|jgi:hypothetical protein